MSDVVRGPADRSDERLADASRSDARRLDAERGVPIEISFNGHPVPCFDGETLATALLAEGVSEFGTTRSGAPRQPLCNMGTCFDCVLVVDGAPLTRSCLTYAVDGMVTESSRGV